jgi:hypothetical protein
VRGYFGAEAAKSETTPGSYLLPQSLSTNDESEKN